MNMKLHLIISLLLLGLVSSQAYPKSKLEFLNELHELFNTREYAINRFQTLGIFSEKDNLTLKKSWNLQIQFVILLMQMSRLKNFIMTILNNLKNLKKRKPLANK